MSVKYSLLALLERGPAHGYQLRQQFETTTGATWPLNIGQVYSTLSRLERDGLVEPTHAESDDRVVYRITSVGHGALEEWFKTPVAQNDRPRDELAIKLALALSTPGVDVSAVVQAQRTATLRGLQELTRLKYGAGDGDLAWLLVLDSLIFQSEAEVRWLDHCEARVLASAPQPIAIAAGADTRIHQEVR